MKNQDIWHGMTQKQVESLGLDEKSKSKFLIEKWRKLREAEAEEKRAE